MQNKYFKIKTYWDEKAEQYITDPKATTNEYWLRELEIKEITRALKNIKRKRTILDVGCGDGYSTIKIWKNFSQSNINIIGTDYSQNMIRNAHLFLKKNKINSSHIQFFVYDLLDLENFRKKFDVVISDRCLINLPSRAMQKRAIGQIAAVLNTKGFYIMVENFIEGHKNMNKLRKKLGLQPIPVRWHNLFFNENFLYNAVSRYFNIIAIKNIGSLFYLITKVVYSKLCQLEKKEVDYNHPIYSIAVELEEIAGDFGPLRLVVLQKK